MVTLEPIQTSLFPNLYHSFLIDDDPMSGEQEWRNIFDYQWDNEEGHCGYAMLEEGVVVGMLGMIFSERNVDGRTHRFCNLHTWWVREDHRGRSLALLRPLLRLDGYTITHFTPCDKVRAVSRRLGFRDLDSQLRILLPFGSSRRGTQQQVFALTDETRDMKDILSDTDRTILNDHQPYPCGHLLVRDGGDYCYLLYTYVTRHRLPYCHIHYVSNMDIFAEQEQAIRSMLLSKHKARFVALDARLVRDRTFRYSFDFWAPAHALYKSADIKPAQIDNLYSDIVFLNLTVLPDMTHEFAKLARRIWPLSRN